MNRCTFRLLLRSVRRSLGRYLAILAIVALGVGFFSGLKSSCPAMLGTADAYFHRQRFEDFRLLSSLGLTQEDAAEKNYPARRQELDFANGQVLNGRYEVEKGQKELDEEKEKAERELADAEQELLDGETEYADAVRDAAEQLDLELFTLNRDANPGAVTFESDTRIIDGLANAFPLFFVLVAALVCATTMTRMVGEERTEIGTMKALGYSDGAIIRKYLLYAGSAALLGCVLGFFLGTARRKKKAPFRKRGFAGLPATKKQPANRQAVFDMR